VIFRTLGGSKIYF